MNTPVQDASSRGLPPDDSRHLLTRGPLVVVAGIPGAGKSAALQKLRQDLPAGSVSHRSPDGDRVVLDSASVRLWLRSRLPQVPYPLLRPVVHTAHWARILILTLTQPRPLVIHETATRPLVRGALRALARCARRPVRLVWIEVPAPVALHGQIDRCRVIRPHAFARHLRRIEQEHPAIAARRTWDTVYVTDRDTAPAAILAACTCENTPPSSTTRSEAVQRQEQK